MAISSSISSSEAARPRHPARFLYRWNVAVLMSLLVVFGSFLAASEWLIRRYVAADDLLSASVAFMRRTSNPNAIFGDSIAARGFQGREDFANLAFAGEAPARTAIRIRAYFRDRKPGMVMLPANYNMLRRDPEDTRGYEKLFADDGNPLLYVLDPDHARNLIKYWEVLGSKREFRSDKYLGPNGELLSTDPAGYEAYARLTPEEREQRAHRAATKLAAVNYARLKGNQRQITDIVQYLGAQGARICLIAFPVAPAMRAAIADSEFVQTADRFYRDLATESGARYVYLRDLLDDPALFINEDHLNPRGAKLLADRAAWDCFGLPPQAVVAAQATRG